MLKKGSLGIWFSTNSMTKTALAAYAQKVEACGYEALWYPESMAYEALTLGGFLLGETDRLKVASGIANIYARDAFSAAAGYDGLCALYGERFIFGLGVSHVPLVEGLRGHQFTRPVATMRRYLADMAAAQIDPSLKRESRNIILAALGPRMLALSGEQAKGALPYNVTPEHTVEARRLLGAAAWLCVEQKICLTTDRQAWRRVAADQLGRYLALPSYRNTWLRLGFSEDEIGGDRFLDAMVAWGSEAQIRSRIDAHFAAGADHVCIQPFAPDGTPPPDAKALECFAG